MRYVVICYSIHEKRVASHDSFESYEDAFAFLEEDAKKTYEEEVNDSSEPDKDSIEFTNYHDGTAYLSSCSGEYEWTWEICQMS